MQNKCFHLEHADLMDWNALRGFKRISEYKACCFLTLDRKLRRMAINCLNIHIPFDIHTRKIHVPETLFVGNKEDIDEGTIKMVAKNWMETWHLLEEENIEILTELWYLSVENKCVALSNFIKCVLDATIKKCKGITRHLMDYRSHGYSPLIIKGCQFELHEKYRMKMGKAVEIS